MLFYFPNCCWLPWSSTFGSWFGLYVLCCCCFYMGGNKVFIFIIRSMSFRCLLKIIKLFFLAVIVYWLLLSLLINEDQSRSESLTVYHLFLGSISCIWDNSVIKRYSFKREICLIVQSAIYPFLVYEYII